MNAPVTADVISRLKAVLGAAGWSQDPGRLAPKLLEWRDRWSGETPLLVLPKSTAEVAAVVGVCAQSGTPITPQGGNTGLVGGQIPRGEILLSLERMRTVRGLEPLDDAITVEAGAPLAVVQQAARDAGRLFPLSLASEGTATIGGLISTNAGGTAVLRYGPMRDLVLGIEAVLPNGEVFAGLKVLRKDNTGYDLKQLLIGAEGTLGVVTAASLKLFPIPASRATAMAGLARAQDAITLLARAKQESGGGIEAFELMGRMGVDFALKHISGLREPLEGRYPWYVLVEAISSEPGGAEAALERLLAGALEDGLIQDAAIAQSHAQAQAFWRLREDQSAAQKPEGLSWKHDVSVPVSKVAVLLERAGAEIARRWPRARIAAFGHVGDGNIHYNISEPEGGDPTFDADREACALLVHDIVADLGGSISAEHGLGVMKTEDALRYKSPAEVQALRAIRAALDPQRIMNPRVLF
ncbi:MAG TPA: FAD-binding oxidoreductase [Caulobacteraceae bacterium]|nr:FAD-binding oxidoreductase [Caulobacteraceae bacterium]